MNTQPAVPGAEIGVITAPGTSRVGKDKNTLLVIHEGLRLGEIDRSGTGLDGETVRAILTALADNPPRASRNLGHHVGAEPLYDLVERALLGSKRRQAIDHDVPAFYCVTV